MSKFIVTTTINPPTKALKLYASMSDWTLIVVGDKKTPHAQYENLDCIYLTPQDQEKISKGLSDCIGWNLIERRNFGFIEAIRRGAEQIAVVDDDNVPLSNWGENVVGQLVEVDMLSSGNIVMDPLYDLKSNTKEKFWHRGYPIDLIHKRRKSYVGRVQIRPMVQANLWNGEPDIDAINRMINRDRDGNINILFDTFDYFTAMEFLPFNSQNIIVSADVIKDYYLMPRVGRISDIWAAYRLQQTLMDRGNHPAVVFGDASVVQERNEHDVLGDFSYEVLGHFQTSRFLKSHCNYEGLVTHEDIEGMEMYRKLIERG
jgi:hypothetical protein